MFRIILLLFLFLLNTSYSEEISLNTFIDEAIKNNPELKVKKEMVVLLKISKDKAGVIEPPSIGIGLLNIPTNSFSLIEEDMTMTEIKLMQMIPFPVKLLLRQSIADYEVQIAEEEYKDTSNKIKSEVKKSYYDLFLLNKSISITTASRDILKSFAEIATAKYRSEKGLKSDILKAEVEVSKMTSELFMLNQKKETAIARFNTLLYRDVNSKIPEPVIEKTIKTLNLDELKNIAFTYRPVLRSMLLKIQQTDQSFELSKTELLPDFDIGLSYGIRGTSPTGIQRSNAISLMANLSLPFLWGKPGYEVRETENEIKVKKAEYEAMKNETLFMIKDTLAETEKNIKNLELYESGILLQAKEAMQTNIINYKSNTIDFLTLLDSVMTYYKFQIEYYKELKEYEQKIAELEFIIGGEIK